MKNLFYSNHPKLIIIFGSLVLFFLVILILGSKRPPTPLNPHPPIFNTPQQKPFKVLSTTPKEGDTGVALGEIPISFTTDEPLQSSQSANINFNPQLDRGYTFMNSFPATKVQLQITGGLKPATLYTITIDNSSGEQLYSWRFTSAKSTKGASSSSLIGQEEQNYVNTYTPLLSYTPYSTGDFSLDYTAKLTLTVKIKNPDVVGVKQEVIDWIKSHGVDPNTHKIIYVNAF